MGSARRGFLVVFGTVWFYGADPEEHPELGLILAAGGIGMFVVLAMGVYRRGSRMIEVLRNGLPAVGTVTQVRHNLAYQPYPAVAEQWSAVVKQVREAGESNPLVENIVQKMVKQYQQVRCRVAVPGEDGDHHEVAVRCDLSRFLQQDLLEPKLELLCDPTDGKEAIVLGESYPNLTLSSEGHWMVEHSTRGLDLVASFARSLVPVAGSYLAAVLGVTLFDEAMPEAWAPDVSPPAGAAVVLLLTVTHAVLPVFFFRYFLDFLAHFGALLPEGEGAGFGKVVVTVMRGVAWLLLGAWFGFPVIALAFLTGWLNFGWAVVHLAFAPRSSRRWLFIEYGSAAMALLLFVTCFSAGQLLPAGIVVVVLQAMLLTVLDWKARKQWTA